MRSLPPSLRVAVWSALGLAALAGMILLAYELALARVPQHRATLERLVRAQTGLDVRFNELVLRWGWYGPEAIFHRVELGEPGRSNVLVRAPQLTLGFDAWRSAQSGQLQVGRITFAAPEINLERNARNEPARASGQPTDADQHRTRLLERWRGGRLDIEGGTLRLPDPAGSADALTLQIRHASLRRSKNQWSASALVFLPERLGHAVRVAAQLQGNLAQLSSLSGSARFEGVRLVFAGWRQVTGAGSPLTRELPLAGEGDVSFRLTLNHGRIQKADGRIHSRDVLLAGGGLRQGTLNLERVSGVWRLVRRSSIWQLRVEDLDVGSGEERAARPDLAVDVGRDGRVIRGELDGEVPIASLAAVSTWFAPEFDWSRTMLEGAARDVKFDWDRERLEGQRLRATARGEDLSFTPPSGDFTLAGLDLHLEANENGLDLLLESEKGRLTLAHAPQQPLADLRIASELRLSREGAGWHLNTPLLTIDHGAAQLILSGSLTKQNQASAPWLDLRATVVRADASLLKELLAEDAEQRFGAVVEQLVAGRIERAQFQLQGEIQRPPQLFAGALHLRDAGLASGESWPEIQGLDAQLEWSGPRLRARLEKARAGSIELIAGEAQWSSDGSRPLQLSGEAHGRLEEAVPWLAAHPKLENYAPRLRNIGATGEARINFDVSLPRSSLHQAPARASPRRSSANEPAVRVALLMQNGRLQLAEDMPAIESLRGSLAFERGRLQRSTLTGGWLGGPVTLRLSERRERRGVSLVVQTQGLLDARELVALTGSDPLPEVVGETAWSGELIYQPAAGEQGAHWRAEADASLVGVSSRLPDPLSKAGVTAMPLRLQASGSGASAQIKVSLADRLHSRVSLTKVSALRKRDDARWIVERGAIQFGSGSASLPAEPLITVQGELNRFDLQAYASLWQRAGNLVHVPAIVADLVTQQLWLADRMFPEVRVQGRKADGVPSELSLASPQLNGSVRWPGSRPEVHLSVQNLDEAERARIVAQLRDSWDDPIITLN